MILPILQQIEQNDLKGFIDFWAKLYSNTPELEKIYCEAILKDQFDENDIQLLFKWKNGMTLSKSKQNSLDKNVKAKLNLINNLKIQDPFQISDFLDGFQLSAVWKIFLLHIIKPNVYPIYDQNINRDYNYIHGLPYKSLSADSLTDTEKEYFYFNTYMKFINGLPGINLKTLDQAFFAFGQFIRSKENQKLFE